MKFSSALNAARITPMVRAQTAPWRTKMPARATKMPNSRWTQPHVVTSNWKIHSSPTT